MFLARGSWPDAPGQTNHLAPWRWSCHILWDWWKAALAFNLPRSAWGQLHGRRSAD